jgi:ankyrin repeat protein
MLSFKSPQASIFIYIIALGLAVTSLLSFSELSLAYTFTRGKTSETSLSSQLQEAVLNKNFSLVKKLVSQGASTTDVNEQFHTTVVGLAARFSDQKMLSLLLSSSRVSLEAAAGPQNLLAIAAAYDVQGAIINYLLENKALVNPTNVPVTPLSAAAGEINAKNTKLLLEHGADINQRSNTHDYFSTALDFLIRASNKADHQTSLEEQRANQIFEEFISKGAHITLYSYEMAGNNFKSRLQNILENQYQSCEKVPEMMALAEEVKADSSAAKLTFNSKALRSLEDADCIGLLKSDWIMIPQSEAERSNNLYTSTSLFSFD